MTHLGNRRRCVFFGFKTGVGVRWILLRTGKRHGTEAIYLPCPVVDLVRLAACASQPFSNPELGQVLRSNPTLLLVALAEFRAQHAAAPHHATELIQWCRFALIPAMAEAGFADPFLVQPVAAPRKKNQQKFFKAYLEAGNNRKLRKALANFLKSFAELESQSAKRLVKKMVGKQLRGKQFNCSLLSRKSTRKQILNDWVSTGAAPIDLPGIFRLASEHLHLVRNFDSQLSDEKLKSVKELAYGASHEINNPLANIATRAQTMLTDESDHEKRHKLSVIYEQAMRAHEMISDMMLFAHPPKLQQKQVSFRLLMSRVIHELKPLLATIPGLETRVYMGAGVDQVTLDPTQVSVAIECLVRNSVEALDAAPYPGNQPDRKIELRVAVSRRGQLEISVWDNGRGISAEVARHMFDPFYSGREAGRGLGFGLAKVWTIARLHGGTLRYENDSESGTCFVLSIPTDLSETRPGRAAILSIREKPSQVEDEAA